MVDRRSNILTLILNLMAEIFSEISLILILASISILPQDHLSISKFISASLMSQITSIVSKIRKTRSKRKNIQFTQFYYESLRISDLKKEHNFIILICVDMNTQLLKNHPRFSLIFFKYTDTITGYQCITRTVNAWLI